MMGDTTSKRGIMRVVALAAAAWFAIGAAPSAARAPGCAACKADAARRFLGSNRVIRCDTTLAAEQEARLRTALRRCERRSANCAAVGDPEAIITVLQKAVAAVQDSVCDRPCIGDQCGAGGVDPSTIRGPVGEAPPAVDPATAPSFEDVARFCVRHPDFDAPPPLLALPAGASLPEWCNEDDAYAGFVATCGVPRVVFVAKDDRVRAAHGSVAQPFASITDALAACQGVCHVIVGPGTYIESPQVTACTFIEGGVALRDGVATRGASRPRIEGHVDARGAAIVLARLDIQDSYGALTTNGDVLVSEAVLRGGYEGGSSAFAATGPRICRSHIAAGYDGFDIAWHSSRLWLAGSAVSACYEGMGLSWGSRGLRVLDSVVYGGYAAVGTSWGSVDVEVRGNRLGSESAAVSVHIAPDEYEVFPATFDVTVTGNVVASGALPLSDPALNIVVQDNVFE